MREISIPPMFVVGKCIDLPLSYPMRIELLLSNPRIVVPRQGLRISLRASNYTLPKRRRSKVIYIAHRVKRKVGRAGLYGRTPLPLFPAKSPPWGISIGQVKKLEKTFLTNQL